MDVTSYLLGKKSGGGGSSQEFTIKRGDDNGGGYNYILDQINEPIKIDDTLARYMFYRFKGKKIPILIGTSNLIDMQNMFRECGKYSDNIDFSSLSNFNTSNVTNMAYMFYSCYAKKLDLSSFDTTNVTNMSNMFNGMSYLAILDISSFDISNLTNFTGMFSSCGSYCYQRDGAYTDKIPYVYVKDADTQNWVLTANNGHPSTWTTDNVIIKTT